MGFQGLSFLGRFYQKKNIHIKSQEYPSSIQRSYAIKTKKAFIISAKPTEWIVMNNSQKL